MAFKRHKSSKTGKWIENYDDIFDDTMEYLSHKIRDEDLKNDETLEAFLSRNDSGNNLQPIMEDLKRTSAWKSKIFEHASLKKKEQMLNEHEEKETEVKRKEYKTNDGRMAIAEYNNKNGLRFRIAKGWLGAGKFVGKNKIVE